MVDLSSFLLKIVQSITLAAIASFSAEPAGCIYIRLYASEPIKHPNGLEPPKT